MKILALETSQKQYSIAVGENDQVLAQANVTLPKLLESSLTPHIQGVLDEAKLDINDIDGFAVGLGPGSFTSLRVGVSSIKALALAANKPVVGISSLQVLAQNCDANQVCVLVDAKRHLVYSNIDGDALSPVKDVLDELEGEVTFIGDGLSLYKDDILNAKHITPSFVDEDLWQPQAKHLLTLAFKRLSKGQHDEVDSLLPCYLYPEDCQVHKPNKG